MRPWLIASLVLTAAAAALSLFVYYDPELFGQLPPLVPVHWNIHNQPDQWVAREDLLNWLLIPPGVMLLAVVGTVVLPRLTPNRDWASWRGVFDYTMFLVVALFGFIHVVILRAYFGLVIDSALLMGGMCVFFALMGNVLGQVRRNPYVGVRTPWTLASDQVWNDTHRLAAWLFVGAGVLGLAWILLGGHPLACLGFILAAALYPVYYSYALHRRLLREGRP